MHLGGSEGRSTLLEGQDQFVMHLITPLLNPGRVILLSHLHGIVGKKGPVLDEFSGLLGRERHPARADAAPLEQ